MKKYCEDFEETLSPLMAIEEANRCLLCEDAPCSQECPAGTSPDRFIRSLYFRNLRGAAEIIRENNILGGICARVCPTEKYCKKGCSRSNIDRPIEIGKLQKFLTDYEKKINLNVLPKFNLTKDKVAIIGSGPSGLAAAYELAKFGYRPTIFEKYEKFGGWLRYGIPQYRLGEDILDYEIDFIKNQGIQFVNNCEFGKTLSLDDLNNQDFKAILFATGNNQGKMLPLLENCSNVEIAVDFLGKIKRKEINKIDEKVIIVGGGDVALDVASSCKLLGANNIKVIALETLDNLPASKEEMKIAEELNIQIIGGFIPKKVENNKIIFNEIEGEDKLELYYDKIVLAIGQMSTLPKDLKNKQNNIFFSGDIVEGDKTVVGAIKTGKTVANEINKFLGGE